MAAAEEDSSLGPWAGADLDATAQTNAGVGADAGLPKPIRFASAIAKLIRRVMAEQGLRRGTSRPAIFLLAPNGAGKRPQFKPKRVPMLDNGLEPVEGRLWFVNETLASGKFEDLPDVDDDGLFSVVTDELLLGEVPAVIVDPRTTLPSARYYPKGLSNPDYFEALAVSSAEVTHAGIFEVIERIYINSLVTPEAQSLAGKVWVNGEKCWPVENAEDLIQLYLRSGLTAAFPTCTVRFEQTAATGRLDLKIEEASALDRSQITRHAILELKVLRSFGSTGKAYSAETTLKWVTAGVEQAATYRDDWGARLASLCCFDMRKEHTAELCFDHVRELAKQLTVELRVWFLFGTSKRFRRFQTRQH